MILFSEGKKILQLMLQDTVFRGQVKAMSFMKVKRTNGKAEECDQHLDDDQVPVLQQKGRQEVCMGLQHGLLAR